MRQSAIAFAVTTAALVLAAGSLVVAGPLSPAAGPVASTYKTLTEVEPRVCINAVNTSGDADSVFKIVQPGSYYLAGNVNGVAAKAGIEIASDDVTIDLNGFALLGVINSLDGVVVTGNMKSNITVKNGSVSGWGGDGVDLNLASSSRIEDLSSRSNVGTGIYTGRASVVTRCTAFSNHALGIYVRGGSVIADCSTRDNITTGIELAEGSRATDCISQSNNAYGFEVGTGCTLSRCSTSTNAVSAVRISGSDGEVIDCTLLGTGGFPVITIGAVDGARIEHNMIKRGTFGISGSGTTNALVVGNQFTGQSADETNLSGSNQIGGYFSAGGTINGEGPHANFSR